MGPAPTDRLEPGQIWLIEQDPGTALAPFDRGALTSANVVIYDRALAPVVARVLPIGSYAEAVSHDRDSAGPAISARALAFAADGWSVVQLVEARRGWRGRMHDGAAALIQRGGVGDPSVLVIAKTAVGRYRSRGGGLPNLEEIIGGFAEDDLLTLILGPLAPRHPRQTHAFTANGLAG